MKLTHILRPATGVALACSTLAGCVSPTLVKDIRQTTDDTRAQAAQTTEDLYARIRRDRAAVEAEQEVSRPYLAGKRVAVARNVTLPLSLRNNVDTLVMFPERTMPLAVVAQRITMATGIPVKIESDVYLPTNVLMPRSLAPQAQQALKSTPANGAPAPMGSLGPTPSLGGPLPASLTGGGVGSTAGVQATPLVENALNVEFKNSEKMPLATMLDLVATRLGINWEFVPSKGVIRFHRLVTKTWQLPIQPGTNSFTTEFKQTSQGSGSTGNSGGSNSSQIDAAAKAELKELDDMEEVKKSLNPVRTMVGDLDLNRGTGLLTMRDTREAVEAADEIVRRQVAIYSRMVTLKFQMIDLSVTDTGEGGADWSVVLTKALENLPGFTLSALSPATLVSGNAGSFGLTMNSGGFTGTQAIVSALKQYGTVTSSVTIPVSMRNRHAFQYNNRRTFSYVSSTTPATTTAGGTGGIPGISTSTATVGFKLQVYADATTRDDVNLQIAFDQSKQDGPLEKFTSGTGANQQSVQNINLVAKGIPKQDLIVRNGQTVVMTAFEQDDTQLTRRTLGESLPILLGGSLTASKIRTFTLVLATVMVQDQGEPMIQQGS
ncbi:type IVB pilus formation outer membrane protein, R64 PilN family [Cupriavidus sp. YR651]|uniref:protein PilN n=1 Tax=Cupriavidus sp. YR651 TaxID=1855315 RepID=UPI000882508F|nr:protein PilN [Cupriavidus sp. YR651]SDD57325.1 type IVB pilus formation outer membrane protein, R64 PilN family [Cupriavidus sp. YR651]